MKDYLPPLQICVAWLLMEPFVLNLGLEQKSRKLGSPSWSFLCFSSIRGRDSHYNWFLHCLGGGGGVKQWGGVFLGIDSSLVRSVVCSQGLILHHHHHHHHHHISEHRPPSHPIHHHHLLHLLLHHHHHHLHHHHHSPHHLSHLLPHPPPHHPPQAVIPSPQLSSTLFTQV